VDLPTYTNIWRIEKRLYKLYDFRLPAPLPITWIAVFAGITVPYIVFLVAIGLPFNHNLVWLYILPPGVLTWLITRPVIESKRLPELVGSQLRYLAEPRTWCRMAPFAEKDDIFLSVRVWHRHPSVTAPKTARKAVTRARQGKKAQHAAVAAGSVGVYQVAEAPAAPRPALSPRPSVAAAPSVPHRATAQPKASRTRTARQWSAAPEPDARPSEPAREQDPGVIERPAWAAPAGRKPEFRPLEVSHDPEPDPGDLWEPRPAVAQVLWPPTGPAAVPVAGPFPVAGAFPEVGAFPDVGLDLTADGALEADDAPEAGSAQEAAAAAPAADVPDHHAVDQAEVGPAADAGSGPGPALELEPLPDPGQSAGILSAPVPHAAPWLPSLAASIRATPAPVRPRRSMAAKLASIFIDLDAGRPEPTVERALSGPGSQDDTSWQRRVRVVTGGHGPGQRDQQVLDRDRASQPLAGPCRIAVLGCISGAGQSVTALMIGQVLADVREVPVAALDLNPGDTSLAACIAPVTSVTALLAGSGPGEQAQEDPGSGPARRGIRTRPGRGDSGSWLDVIVVGPPGTDGAHPLGAGDYQRLADLLATRYPLTVIDLAPSGLTRVLPLADQLVLVAPASPEAAISLASTQRWLTAHGYHDLAARAVTVVNRVSGRTSQDVLRAESVARGRCRAIVRVPWDDRLSTWPGTPAALQPQTRLAYTALAGVLVAGLGHRTAGVANLRSRKEC
jgi:MinD-like ATPase involved in chromosome partitioning or flagellar assembly